MPITYEPITTQTLTATATSVTFSSIPQTYTDLVCVVVNRVTTGVSYNQFNFNSDTGTNYSRTQMSGSGSAAASIRFTNETTTYPFATAMTTTANAFDTNVAHIFNYSNTTTYKTILGRGNNAGDNTGLSACLWRSTAAITSITITSYASTFVAGSTFTLYGIKAA